MDNILIMTLFVLLISLFVVLLVVLRRKYKKEIIQKDKLIKNLTARTEKLHEIIRGKERRGSFRLKVDIDCKFQPIKIGDKKIEILKDDMHSGVINDISFTGLQLETTYNLEIKEMVEIWLDFELEHRKLQLKGLIVRKEDNIKKQNVVYGIKFVGNNMTTHNKLNQLIRLKEIERKRSRKSV